MRISGLQKVTLLDYPGHIACTVFLGRCNLRCPFCHNMELVEHPEHYPEISVAQILEFLNDRKGKLEGVAITGGEPLLDTKVYDLISEIKKLGFPIKLDSNGFFPDRIKYLLDNNMIDMIAMDIKSSYENYLLTSGVKDLPYFKTKIDASISYIINSNIDYEFRTTCVKGLHTASDFYVIKDMIKGAKKYFLQNYRSHEGMENLPFESFTRNELMEFQNIVKDSVGHVEIRGVD